jgi:sodium/potassium-transporting ATPase subunit alpha
MGSGSDVAKNAADMILLNDDFSSIVNGVEEGRLIFDNLKKSIAYTLSSNIPEISPFIMFILFQVPLPLSTVLILCIDLGTDMVPAISFAYENAELDIMERMPRNSKRDHLVNVKLISFAYLQIGMVQAAAGFYTYFVILNDYGIRPGTLFFLSLKKGIFPKDTDVYNPDVASPYGNTNWPTGKKETLAWNLTKDGKTDVRLFYYTLEPDSWVKCRWDPNDTSIPSFWRKSWVTERQICYTTEALKFAQGGYLISIVCVQWADLMICKCRSLSISQQGMINGFGNFGIFFETALVAILAYVMPFNIGLGTRHVASPHFAVPSFSFFVVIMFYDELRKNMLRGGVERVLDKNTGLETVKFVGWIAQNTYY